MACTCLAETAVDNLPCIFRAIVCKYGRGGGGLRGSLGNRIFPSQARYSRGRLAAGKMENRGIAIVFT